MKKILAVLLLITVLGIGVVPTLAAPLVELNDLARYFPSDTAVFMASRIDDAFFEELDSLVARVANVLPPGTVPPMTIAEGLDMVLAEEDPPMTFQEDIRPWLGDTVAIGILEIPMQETSGFMRSPRMNGMNAMRDDAPALAAVAITDREAVTNFFVDAMENSTSEFERSDEADYTLFTNPENEDQIVVIRDDVLLVTNQADTATTLPDGSLSDSADFNDTFALLPETDYNISVFINLPQFLTEAMEQDPEAAEMMGMFGDFFNAIGPQAWGGTLLDEVSLTIDIAQQLDSTQAYEQFGLPSTPPPPVDPAFAARIPASAPLVYLATDISRSGLGFFTVIEQQVAAMVEADLADEEELTEMQEGIDQFEATFTTFTGLDLREDVLSWMTGQYAVFLMLNPELNLKNQFGLFTAFPVDFGVAIEATDPDAAAATVTGFTQAIERLAALSEEQEDNEAEVEISTETMFGTDVTVVTITSREAPWPIEVLMGANDDVFAIGTRNGVQAILSGDGGLAANESFTRAQTWTLDGAYNLAYLGPDGLAPLADLITTFAEEDDEDAAQLAQAVRDVLALIDSATVSQTLDENSSISRMSLNLSK